MSNIVYDDLESFNNYKADFYRFQNIKVSKTKYSIKIDYGRKKVFLRKKDVGSTNILGLISRVKKDAKKYINSETYEKTSNNDIFWYYYNDENDVFEEGFEVTKIDISAAYWTKAINLKILSKETVDYFNSLKFEGDLNLKTKKERDESALKEKKMARLKALGSLATVKRVEIWHYGKRDSGHYELIFDADFRDLYLTICNDVAKDMQSVLCHVNGIYYYWDCIFVEPKYTEEVGRLFNSLGYNYTVEKHEAYIFKSKHISYICCPNKDGDMVRYPLN